VTSSVAVAGRVTTASPQRPHWLGPLLVLVVGMFMTILDSSIINVAIPTIQSEFGGSTSDVAWVSTAYSLVLGVVVPTTAWLGDRLGLDRVYCVSLVGFAAGSALCGISWSLGSLIAFRVIQAAAGGILPVITMTMVMRIVPPGKIGSAMGIYGIGMVAAPAIGPTLGGYLVEYVNWRLIFYINVPVAIVGLALALWMLPRFGKLPVKHFDVWGFGAIAGGLVCLLLALSQGESWGWTSNSVIGLILGGLLLLALFVVIELEVDNPLLDLGVFRNWPFVNSLLIISVQTVGMFATMFFIPVFLQGALGMGAMEAGVLMLPQALMMGIVAPISGRLFDRFGPRWVAFIGLIMASAATYLMTGLTLNVSRGQIIWWTCLRAIGVSLAMMAVTSSGISALEPRIVSSGTAFNNIAQRVSAALGLAALSAMVTGMQAQFSAARYGLIAATSPLVSGLTLPQLYQLGTQTTFEVMANAYTNAFRITTWFTLAAAVLSLGLRSGRVPQPADGAPSSALD